MKPRHVPLRTCSGCREQRPKREMVRVVRLEDASVVVDETGRRNGRGAYLCRAPECWQRALRTGSLAHALKVPTISASDKAALDQAGQQLLASA